VRTGRRSVDADFSEREGLTGFANLGAERGAKKIYAFACSYYRSVSVRFDEHGRLFVDGHFPRRLRPSILHNASQETEGAAHAIALREMRIGEEVSK